MAAKKYYAVKKGKVTGVFKSWAECRDAVDGYSGARYKGFSTLEEAEEYLGETCLPQTGTVPGGDVSSPGKSVSERDASLPGKPVSERDVSLPGKSASRKKSVSRMEEAEYIPRQGELLAYVDGSYDDGLKKYAFGCVFLLPDGRVYTEYGNGDNEQSLQLRNVTGEMLGAMYAVKFAMLNGFESVEIRYDYQGIEKWVTGEWRSKTDLTRKYAVSMREWGRSIYIRFTKVAAHTNVRYNELADRMAKTGLTLGNGVPKIRRIEDMEEYDGANEVE